MAIFNSYVKLPEGILHYLVLPPKTMINPAQMGVDSSIRICSNADFMNQKIISRVKNFEDSCDHLVGLRGKLQETLVI